MKSMLKIMAILAALFASTFLILNVTGLLTTERITHWLTEAHEVSPLIIGSIVALLLFADLFVAMPTLTIMLLSGYFLGATLGATFSIVGLLFAGFVGYGLSQHFGQSLVKRLISNDQERQQAISSFQRYGVGTILLSRAMPVLPEVSACMAGLTRMPFLKFAGAWSVSAIPYAFIAAYAGSISSAANPTPAILTAVGLTSFFWISWAVYRAKVMQK